MSSGFNRKNRSVRNVSNGDLLREPAPLLARRDRCSGCPIRKKDAGLRSGLRSKIIQPKLLSVDRIHFVRVALQADERVIAARLPLLLQGFCQHAVRGPEETHTGGEGARKGREDGSPSGRDGL